MSDPRDVLVVGNPARTMRKLAERGTAPSMSEENAEKREGADAEMHDYVNSHHRPDRCTLCFNRHVREIESLRAKVALTEESHRRCVEELGVFRAAAEAAEARGREMEAQRDETVARFWVLLRNEAWGLWDGHTDEPTDFHRAMDDAMAYARSYEDAIQRIDAIRENFPDAALAREEPDE